ncbi:MAG: hypothetical protein HYZ21_16175 [Chloroflexi bacterium]|nr:hypothetical protein [Chloroflexota bacterium]
MGIEEIQHAVVAITVKSVFGVGDKQSVLNIDAGRFGILQPYVFIPFRKPWIVD